MFVRISDADSEMLRFLGERGIVPGTRLELVERQPFDGPLFVRAGGDTHVLGATLARAMHVQREKEA
jgi:DtxR family Mn-dependent transcriptional regulator